MRTAIVSSSYNEFGGTEKVDNIFGKLYPDADLFLLFGDSRFIPEQLRGRVTSYSALQKLRELRRPIADLCRFTHMQSAD